MENICKDSALCTGCETCKNVCPTLSIKMVRDSEGFLIPRINRTSCIDCGVCVKKCPVNFPPAVDEEFNRFALIGRNNNHTHLEVCSSGGVFTALATYIIKNNGVVYGAVFDEQMHVCHERIASAQEITKLSGSKYVQSEMGEVFRRIGEDIKAERTIMFCGTPCQCSGLANYLGVKRKKVILVDLVCHGVPSPLLWESYLQHIMKKSGKVVSANFRSKHWGYHMGSMETISEQGKKSYGSARINLMLKSYFKNIADRYSCYDCRFKTVNRCTDLTLFDAWHAAELNGKIVDDDMGYTCIIVQSQNGKNLINNAKCYLNCYSVDLEKAISMDGVMVKKSTVKPDGRDSFYASMKKIGLEKSLKHFYKTRWLDYAIESLKPLVRALKKIIQ